MSSESFLRREVGSQIPDKQRKLRLAEGESSQEKLD